MDKENNAFGNEIKHSATHNNRILKNVKNSSWNSEKMTKHPTEKLYKDYEQVIHEEHKRVLSHSRN